MSCAGPILIGGTGRSGTTLLVRILDKHPEIFTLRWESQFLVAPGGLLNVARSGFQCPELDRFAKRLRGRWYRRVLHKGQPNEYEAGLIHDVREEELEAAMTHLHTMISASGDQQPERVVREFTESLFGPPTERAGAHRWCEKTPRNVLFVDQLMDVFPNLRFIHIVRDGRDVAASMVARGFWPITAGHEFPSLRRFRGTVTWKLAAAYWKEVLDLAREKSSSLPKENYIEVRFEDLIDQPRLFLQKLCSFLGVPYSEELLEQDLTRHHIGRWRQEADPADIENFYEVAGEVLQRMGYV